MKGKTRCNVFYFLKTIKFFFNGNYQRKDK